MAMDLRRRNKPHVMETMEGKTDFHVDWMDNIAEGRDKTARRAHGLQPEKSMALADVEFVSGVYPGRRFHRLAGRHLTDFDAVSAREAHDPHDLKRRPPYRGYSRRSKTLRRPLQLLGGAPARRRIVACVGLPFD